MAGGEIQQEASDADIAAMPLAIGGLAACSRGPAARFAEPSAACTESSVRD